MFVVDSHCDSLDIVEGGGACDLIRPYNYSNKYGHLQFTALFSGRIAEDNHQSYLRAKAYIKTFHSTMNAYGDSMIWVKNADDLNRAVRLGAHASLLSVEGGKGVMDDPRILSELYDDGVRVFGFVWDHNSLAKSNRIRDGETDTGLSESGRAIAVEGNRLGLIFDVSHMSDKSFYDLFEISEKPLIASHSNFRAICNHSRNLTDDMAKCIFDSDGMVGLTFCPSFIDSDPEKKRVEGLFAHVDHALSLGGEDHIGFGGDIDGLRGNYPSPLTEESSMHDLFIELMLKNNYSESLVKKIAGENYIRFLRKYL